MRVPELFRRERSITRNEQLMIWAKRLAIAAFATAALSEAAIQLEGKAAAPQSALSRTSTLANDEAAGGVALGFIYFAGFARRRKLDDAFVDCEAALIHGLETSSDGREIAGMLDFYTHVFGLPGTLNDPTEGSE